MTSAKRRSRAAGSPRPVSASARTGRRVVKKGSGRTKTEAKDKLKEVLRNYEDGLAVAPGDYTVGRAVTDWLAFGLSGRDDMTIKTCGHLCQTHIVPALGARKLRDLSADDVDRWLAGKATTLSTRTLQGLHSCLNRSIKRAMARDKVKRNVVELCAVPEGKPGRPSKSLTMAQAEAVLKAAEGTRMYAYVVLSPLTGAPTEELRALTWDHIDLDGDPGCRPAGTSIPGCMAFGSQGRRHQDAEVAPHARSARALCRRPRPAGDASSTRARGGGIAVARARPRLHNQDRYAARSRAGTSRLPVRDQRR
jgi:integrase